MAALDNSGRSFWIIFTGFFQMILGGLFDENSQSSSLSDFTDGICTD
jgi:hypothetical protein